MEGSGCASSSARKKIADGLHCRRGRSREPNPKGPFDPYNEFRPRQAVDTEVPFQAAQCVYIHGLCASGMELLDKVLNDGNKFALARLLLGCCKGHILFGSRLHMPKVKHVPQISMTLVNPGGRFSRSWPTFPFAVSPRSRFRQTAAYIMRRPEKPTISRLELAF